MTDMPEPRRRRVAPALADPMAPAGVAPVPEPQVARRVEQAPPPPAPPTPTATAGPPHGRREDPTVAFATRLTEQHDMRLRAVVASRRSTIRDTIQQLIDEAYSRIS